MALYPDYDRDDIFKPIGKSIARYNELVSQKADQETIVSEQIDECNETEGTRDMLLNVLAERESNIARFDSAMEDAVATVESYLQTGVATMLDVVTQGIGGSELTQKVLDALEDAMYLNTDSVLCNTILPPEEPVPGRADDAADIDNAGVGELYIYADNYPQQVHDDLNFEIECIDASVEGSEIWLIRCDKEDDIGRMTSNVTCEDVMEKYGLTFKIVTRTVIYESGDGANQLSNWSLSGAVKRKGNEDSSGDLSDGNSDYYGVYYVKLYDTAGTRTVELYQDSGLTTMVASGSRVGDGTITLAQAGGSGLSGSVDVAYTGDDPSIYVKYPFPHEVGDKFYFLSEVSAAKNFQTFFVEQFDRALPCDDPETVDDDWATWTP